MSNLPQWPLPEWLADLPDVEREAATKRFLLCLATVYLKDKATAADLSAAIGLHPNQVNVMKTRGKVSGEAAVAIESALGRKLFPREIFRPDLFTLPE